MRCSRYTLAAIAVFGASLAGCSEQGPMRLSHLGAATRSSIAPGPGGSIYVAYVDGAPVQSAAYVRFAKDGTHFSPPTQLSEGGTPRPVQDLRLLADARGTVWALYSTAARAGNGEFFARALEDGAPKPALRIGKPLGVAVGDTGALDGVWSWAATRDAAGAIHIVWSEDPRPADQVRISNCAPRAIRHAVLETSGLSRLETLAGESKDAPVAGWRCLDVAIGAGGAPQVLALNLDTQNVELVTPQRATPILASASYDLPEGRLSIGRRWIDAPAAAPRFYALGGNLHVIASRQYTEAERTNLHLTTDTPSIVDLPLESLLAAKPSVTTVCQTPGASILAGGFWVTGETDKPALLVATRGINELVAFPLTGAPASPFPLLKTKVSAADSLGSSEKSRRLLTITEDAGKSWVELRRY